MTFGEKLRSLRIAANLTQDELAARIGVQKQSISRYENSTREPNIKTAKKLADALEISLEDLAESYVYGDDPTDSTYQFYTRLSSKPSAEQDRLCKLFVGIMDGRLITIDRIRPDNVTYALLQSWEQASEDDRLVVVAVLRKYGFFYKPKKTLE